MSLKEYLRTKPKIFNILLKVKNYTICIIVKTSKFFSIQLCFQSYPVVNLKKFFLTIIFKGMRGPALIVDKYYLNKEQFFVDYRSELENQNLKLNEIYYKEYNDNIIPLSILESNLLEDGTYEIIDSNNFIKKNFCIIKESGKYNLILNNGEMSFFHFYIEFLPILLKYYTNKEYNIYFSLGKETYHKSVLEFFDIYYSDFNEAKVNYNLKNKCLVRRNIYPTKNQVIFLSNYLLTLKNRESKKSKKIYITRKGNVNGRQVFKENNLIRSLVNLGFDVINPGILNFEDQVNIFKNASVIVAAHGAALSHLVAVPKNCYLIELNGDKDVRWHYAKMAKDLKIKYSLVLGTTINNYYFDINIELIKKLLKIHFNKNLISQ